MFVNDLMNHPPYDHQQEYQQFNHQSFDNFTQL